MKSEPNVQVLRVSAFLTGIQIEPVPDERLSNEHAAAPLSLHNSATAVVNS